MCSAGRGSQSPPYIFPEKISYFFAKTIPREWAEEERRRRAASVTVRQAAEMLGLTIPQAQYAIRRGRLDKTVGGRVTVESIARYKGAHE